jgi:hypothetical protein
MNLAVTKYVRLNIKLLSGIILDLDNAVLQLIQLQHQIAQLEEDDGRLQKSVIKVSCDYSHVITTLVPLFCSG